MCSAMALIFSVSAATAAAASSLSPRACCRHVMQGWKRLHCKAGTATTQHPHQLRDTNTSATTHEQGTLSFGLKPEGKMPFRAGTAAWLTKQHA